MESRYLFSLLIIFVIFLNLGSCVNDPAPLEAFLIKVDSIHAPDTVASGIPFDIEFFGIIGYDGCHSFKTFNRTIKDNEIRIEAMGSFDNNAAICPEMLVYLDGQKLNMTIAIPGSYKIKIIEPYNYTLVKLIIVK